MDKAKLQGMDKKTIERVILLGTERVGIPQQVNVFLEKYGNTPPASEEEKALMAATIFKKLNKATSEIYQLDVVPQDIFEEKKAKPLHNNSIHHFNLILKGTFSNALEEFVQLVVTANQQFPPESLPQLLDKCVEQPDLFETLKPILGALGHWLIQQNPNWRPLVNLVIETHWEKGKLEERVNYLTALRKESPGLALQQLDSIWEKEPVRNKTKLLKALEHNLSLEDEPFLENCLSLKNKSIRKAAIDLLAKLKGSQMLQSIADFAFQHISIDESQSLHIELPKQIPDFLDKYGIEETPSQKIENLGTHGQKLFQIISRIPPIAWEKHFQISAERLFQIMLRSDWKQLLLMGVKETLLNHPDVKWLELLGRYWMQSSGSDLKWNGKIANLVKLWPDDLFNRLCHNYLVYNPYLIEKESFIYKCLTLNHHSWSDDLTKTMVRNFQNWMANAGTISWGGRHYKAILNVAAFRSNPYLLQQMGKGWQTNGFIWEVWEHDIQNFLNTLRFRKEMQEQFKK